MKIKSKVSIFIALIYIFIYFIFASGVINASIEGQNYNFDNIIPSRSVQNMYETVIGVTILIFGFIGILIINKANTTIKENEKYILIGAGLVIFAISIIFAYRLVEMKG